MKSRKFQSAWTILIALVLASAPATRALEAEPVPVTAESKPFFAAATDLAAYGFSEEEYLVTGTANIYRYDVQGDVEVAVADVPYTTRILVRRPAAHRFNGVVLFEMMNPTAGHDIDFEWHYTLELLLREGYAWVGMTIKDNAIDYLRAWDEGRYGSLSMVDRGLVYDSYGQVGALLREGANPANPLAGYDVEVVIGTGYSQSADYLTTFSNEFHAATLTAGGEPVFDGYLLGGGTGAARRINSADSEFYFDERRFNTVDAPLIRVQSESEVVVFSSVGIRQPDSAVFRLYEIAGGSHADGEGLARTGEVMARDTGTPPLPACGNPLSPLAIGPAHRAGLALLVRWIRHGAAPPPSRWIELDEEGEVLRDELGNALGGLRLPPIEVPLGVYSPVNTGPLPCPVAGSFIAFDEATLDALYPRHGLYVGRVLRSALRGVRQGYLLLDDAARYVIEAARSGVGR